VSGRGKVFADVGNISDWSLVRKKSRSGMRPARRGFLLVVKGGQRMLRIVCSSSERTSWIWVMRVCHEIAGSSEESARVLSGWGGGGEEN